MNARWALILAIACAGAALLACGGGTSDTKARPTIGPLTLQAYFDRVQALDAKSAQRFQNVRAQLGTNLPEEQKLKILRDVVPEQAAIVEDLRDGMAQLEPPAEVKETHKHALAALDAFISFSRKAADGVAKASSFGEATAIINSDEAKAADRRLTDSCLALERAAAEHGITINLDCGQ